MIKQFVKSEVCLKCKGCCRFSQEDSVWLPRILNEEKERLGSKDDKVRLLADSSENNFICAFLNIQNNKCKIYDERPFDCQLYPFLINRRDEKIFLSVDPACPFIKDNWKNKEFKTHAQYLTSLLNRPEYKNILKNNPQIIQAYEGVKDIAELTF